MNTEKFTNNLIKRHFTPPLNIEDDEYKELINEVYDEALNKAMVFINNYEKAVMKVDTLTSFTPDSDVNMLEDIKRLNLNLKDLFDSLLKPLAILNHDNGTIKAYLDKFLIQNNLNEAFSFSDAFKTYLSFINYNFIHNETIRVSRNEVYSFNSFKDKYGVIKFSHNLLIINKSIVYDCLAFLKNLTFNINQSKFSDSLVGYYFMAICELMVLNDFSEVEKIDKLVSYE